MSFKSVIVPGIFLILLSMAALPTKVSPQDRSTSLAQLVDNFFNRAEAFGFSGAVIISRGDQVVLRKGYGFSDRLALIPNKPATVFSLASLDKQFIAAAILRLEEMGKLRTTDSIKKYFDFVPDNKAQITLHHLLSHTSGLKNEYWDEHADMDRKAFVKLVLHDQALASDPGTEWRYSNSGFVVLEEVIERASGKPYETFLQDALFGPAGMTQTGYPSRKWEGSEIAKYHLWTVELPKTVIEAQDLLTRTRARWLLMSTADDMYRWYRALQGNKVLSAESKKKLFKTVKDDYAYGWYVNKTSRGTRLLQHGGSDSGSGMLATFRWYMDEDIFICVLSNTFNQTLSAAYFMGDLESAIFGEKVSLPPQSSDRKPTDVNKVLGTYKFPNGAPIELRQAKDGRLAIVTQDRRAMLLLRFPDAAASADTMWQDKIAGDVIRAAAAGDYEALRKVLAPEQPFDSLKFNLESNKKQFGELRGIKTVYQRQFVRDGVSELQSFVLLEYEKREAVRRVRHLTSGQITIEIVNFPMGVEAVLAPMNDGSYATWDFTLDAAAWVSFDTNNEPTRLTMSGQHGTIVATKQP